MPSTNQRTRVRRTILACSLAVLLVTAGCNALLGTDDRQPTPGETAVNPTTVPGIGANDSLDAQRLAGAHDDALSNRSFTAEQRVVVRDRDDSLVREIHTVGRFAANRSRFHFEQNVSGSNTPFANDVALRVRLFADGERVYRYTRRGSENANARLAVDPDGEQTPPREALPGQPTLRNRIGLVLSAVENPTVTARENVVVVSGTVDPSRMSLNDPDLTATGNGTASVTVGPDGRVREYTVAYDARLDDESVTVRETVAVFGVGETSIARPEWVTALADTNETRTDA